MIRKAKLKDIDTILLLTKACTVQMKANNIYQWNDHYSNKEAFTKDIEREELYVLIKDNRIIGSIVISTFMDTDYQSVQWLTKNKNNLYIHRLAIHPIYQGNGYAQQLMDFAEQKAIENNYTSIRLDTYSQNHRNQKFYELRNYKQLGTVFFPKQSEHPFYCYERVL